MRRIFLLFILLNLIMPQVAYAAPPWSEVDSDIALRGAVFAGDATGLYASYENGQIQITSDGTGPHIRNIKFKGTALNARLKHYNGFTVGITHIADDGTISHYVDTLEIDNQGFAYATYEFSETIISGLTGTTTFTGANLSGNYTKSFTESNISYVDFSVRTDAPGFYNIGGELFTHRKNISVNETFTTAYESEMQADYDDLRFTLPNLSIIPYWIESSNASSVRVWLNNTYLSTTSETNVLMHYGNASVGAGSNGGGTFLQFHGAASSDFIDPLVIQPAPFIYESYIRQDSSTSRVAFGVSDLLALTNDSIWIRLYPSSPDLRYLHSLDEGAASTISESYTQDTNYHIYKIVYNGSSVRGYDNGDQISTDILSNIPNGIMGIFFKELVGNSAQSYAFVREPTITQETVDANASEQVLNISIATSVVGDSNTTDYSAGVPQAFTLIPAANISEIVFNTTSTDWSYTAVLYWTDNVLLTETATNGEYHANITAIVSLSLDDGTINFDITNTTLMNADFSNYVSVSTNDTNFNEGLSDLILSGISLNTTATTGTYYYDLQYDYFYPPQNLTATPDYTYISLNWNDVSNADQYSVYLDGTLLTNVSDSYHTALGLAAGTSYSFDVSAWNNSRQTANTTLATATLSTVPVASVNLSLQDIVIPFYAANDILYVAPISRVNNTALVQYPVGNVTYNISYNSSVAYSNNSTGVVRINSTVLISVYHLTASGIIHFDNSNSVLLQNTDEISDIVSASAIIINSINEVISMLGYIIFIIMMWVFAVVVPINQPLQLIIAGTATIVYILSLMDIIPILQYQIALLLLVSAMTVSYVAGVRNNAD